MKYFIIMLLFLTFSGGTRSEPLKVAVVLDSPFVMKDEKGYYGVAIDLWEEIALALDRKYAYYEYPVEKLNQAFHDIENGKLDIFVAPLAANPDRYDKVDYTIPFFLDKVVAVSKRGYFNNLYTFAYLFLLCVLSLALLLTALIFIYVNILWFSERTHSKNMPSSYREGLTYLFWQHLLRGAPDEVPVTFGGKVAILFQQFGIFVTAVLVNAGFVSYVTAVLVNYESPIMQPDDLNGVLLGAAKNTKAFKIAFDRGYRVQPFETLEEGIEALENNEVKSFIGDYTDVETYLKHHPKKDLDVSHFNLSWNLYAFAVPVGSLLRREVSAQLLKMGAKRIPEHIIRLYMPKDVSINEL